MIKQFLRKYLKSFLWISLISLLIYGSIRLYYGITDGFTIGNITSDFQYNEKWKTEPLDTRHKRLIQSVLDQKFNYLGKGCQSYVFLSQDGQYILKFVKYQRFRPQKWLDNFAFIPFMDTYRLNKIEKKRKKLDMLFLSWKIAYENLQPETGLVYVHLNKSKDLQKKLIIYDKMGFKHELDMDKMEFLIQKRAEMLCPTITALMDKGDEESAKKLIEKLLGLIQSEYDRGWADNDHALMQNTGVLGENPIHVDVGQFVKDQRLKDPQFANQELFSKTFKFRKWLRKHHPSLGVFLEEYLVKKIGEAFYIMQPQVKNHAWSE